MKPFLSIQETTGAFLLLMLALSLQFAQIAAFLLALREKRSPWQTLAAAAHLLAGFLVFVVMLESYDIVKYPEITRRVVQTDCFIFSLPWMVYAGLELLSAGILTRQFREYGRYKANTVTPDAIRRSLDLLPEGICISASDGTVLLTNLKMNALCRMLSGEPLMDSHRLWAALEAKGEDQNGDRLAHTPSGEAWLFSKGSLAIDGRAYERISAVDVTGTYRITEELRQKNSHLQEIRRRMKEAAELSGDMFVKREEAAARTALHNELGQVLLMGRYYLEHPDSTDPAMVALMTSQMNRFLLGESKVPEPESEDALRRAIDMAGSIGVSVELRGEAPREGKAWSLLAEAIRECAANTVKHAEGDRLFVEISEETPYIHVLVRNNGRPPKEPVAESGGLLSLRRDVEAVGGEMRVESLPSFSLHLFIHI